MRIKKFIFLGAFCASVIVILLDSGLAFEGYSNATLGDWYNSSWHFRTRLEINATNLNRTDFPVEIRLNFSSILPYGTFDNNSVRVFEYNNSGNMLHELPSQFDIDEGYNSSSNAMGELVFILNGTTPAGVKRIFYIYYDIIENGAKSSAAYGTSITTTWDGRYVTVNNTKINIQIDTNRTDTSSGIYYVMEREFFVPIIIASGSAKTAEYMEYSNGTHNTTFDFRGNVTIVPGPVRATITMIGPEIEFGSYDAKTNASWVVKKYYIYNKAGPEVKGSFIKISQEIHSSGEDINRSSLLSGAFALDLRRTFLSKNMNPPEGNFTNPDSWVWASGTGGSVAGILNINGSSSGYIASYNDDLGRIGLNLEESGIAAGSFINSTALLYFGTGGGDGVSEFLDIMGQAAEPPLIERNLTEKWNVIIIPVINASIFNRNETVIIRGNISSGDEYSLVSFLNISLDMGTPDVSDDINLTLYDDGTHGDDMGGDKVYAASYTFGTSAEIGEWTVTLLAYGISNEFLNQSYYNFNLTGILSVDIVIDNPTDIASRQVVANITIMNFNRSIVIPGANITCSFNGTDVVNKTDLGNGNYSINFTAPSAIGIFELNCTAIQSNNTGNGIANFTTEPLTISINVSAAPSEFIVNNVTLNSNACFTFAVNASNTDNGMARNLNITLELLGGWISNSTLETCGNLPTNASCMRSFNITVPNGTASGIYIVNASVIWNNPDKSLGINKTSLSINVTSNPQINFSNRNISGIGADGVSKYIASFVVLSIGNDNVTGLNFTCISGTVCSDFNITFSPSSISSLAPGFNQSIDVFADIPPYYSPGNYSGLVNVTSSNISETLSINVFLQNTTNISILTQPLEMEVQNITKLNGSYFVFEINLTNEGNSSARNVTLNLTVPNEWSLNASSGMCPDLLKNYTCTKSFNVTVPNMTLPGIYPVYINYSWVNLNFSEEKLIAQFSVNVTSTPVIEIDNLYINGSAPDGLTTNSFNFTIFSMGNSNLTDIEFSCISGAICENFNLSYDPSSIPYLEPGANQSVSIFVEVPDNFQAGNYSGILDILSGNLSKEINMTLNIPSNRTWDMSPLFCQRSEYIEADKICDITINNTGNDITGFEVSAIIANKTYLNVTNFSLSPGNSYIIGVFYNITGFPQAVYNSTYKAVASNATPIERYFNITLLPFLPPFIYPELSFRSIEQGNENIIYANVTDQASTGINYVLLQVTQPNGTNYQSNMTLVSEIGNFSRWILVFANSTNNTFGNTTEVGLYNITIFSEDNVGNIGNTTSNFSVYTKLNVASYTLSNLYYQGDSGTIYYSLRDMGNSGVNDAQVTFNIFDTSSILIYIANRTTDADGTFEPLPVFTLTSDASIGNYTLQTSTFYNDTIGNAVLEKTNNYTFEVRQQTVSVTGLFTDIETAVVWFPNNIMRFNILVYDGEGRTVDPSALNLRVYDPAQNLYFTVNLTNMTKRGTGFYSYSYAMPINTATGMYLAVANITQASLETMKLKAFRVAAGGPYDVRLTLPKGEAEQGKTLDFSVTVENKGEVTQDVFINYTIIGQADGKVYYSASEAVLTPAFSNQSFTRSAFILSNQPLGTYTIIAVVKYDNTQPEINVSTTFVVISPKTERPTPPASSQPEFIPPATNITNVQVPETIKSLIIEKFSDSVKVYPGFKRIEYVTVRNIGKEIVRGISLNILGIPPSWFKVTPVSVYELEVDNAYVFLVEYDIPQDAVIGDYKASIIVTSPVANDQKSLTISVLKSLSEVLRQEIDSLKKQLKELWVDIGIAKNQGKIVDNVMLVADQADKTIQLAENNFNLNNTETALTNIKDAKVLIGQARDILSKLEPPKIETKAEIPYIFICVIIAAALLIIFFFIRKRKKKQRHFAVHVPAFFSFLEKMKKPHYDEPSLNQEKENALRMINILEKENKEGIISVEAYKEMKNSLNSKLSNLEKKMSNIKKA